MGNLLGSPITTKDTHTGRTLDEQSIDNGGLEFGISSMQGWRVHMEDAHICQPFLYAEKRSDNNISTTTIINNTTTKGSGVGETVKESIDVQTESSNVDNNGETDNVTPPTTSTKKYTQIPLPNHSLFAVFDGHGGSFAAEYAARNLLRVLSRQPKFVQYAEKWREREVYLAGVLEQLEYRRSGGGGGVGVGVNDPTDEKESQGTAAVSAAATADSTTNSSTNNADKLRFQEMKQRGRESDKSVKKIKERVRRHLSGSTAATDSTDDDTNTIASSSSSTTTTTTTDATTNTTSSSSTTSSTQQTKKKEGWWQSTNTPSPTTPQRPTTTTTNNNSTNIDLPTTPQNTTNALQIATAAYDHTLMTLLESSLRDAFCDLDREIYEEVVVSINGGVRLRGDGDRNCVYGVGYPFGGGDEGGVCSSSGGGGGGSEDNEEVVDSSSASPSSSSSAVVEDDTPAPTPTDDEDSGTTAAIVLLTPRWIVCANAGDSRAVYSRSNHHVVALSYDHKPDDEEEERRITDAGGYVSSGRVEGDLAVSRGLGDFRFKEQEAVLSGAAGEEDRGGGGGGNNNSNNNTSSSSSNTNNATGNKQPMLKPSDQKVSPVPDIIIQNRDRSQDEFIIIACDGIWDVQTNQECVNMVAEIFSEGEHDLGLICEEMLDLCLIKGSKDNMTTVVIKFPKQVVGEGGGGVLARRERRGLEEEEQKKKMVEQQQQQQKKVGSVLETR